jgi:hypothetical protein
MLGSYGLSGPNARTFKGEGSKEETPNADEEEDHEKGCSEEKGQIAFRRDAPRLSLCRQAEPPRWQLVEAFSLR